MGLTTVVSMAKSFFLMLNIAMFVPIGFYQPVYVFDANIDGDQTIIEIPAIQ